MEAIDPDENQNDTLSKLQTRQGSSLNTVISTSSAPAKRRNDPVLPEVLE